MSHFDTAPGNYMVNRDGKDVHQVRMIKNIIRKQRRRDGGKLSRLAVWQVE